MKKIFLFIGLLLTTTHLMAEPIKESQAREIATNFFAQHTTRAIASDLKLVWAGSDITKDCATTLNLDNPLLYIYNNTSADGFVIVSGDTNADFIIAYSLDNAIDVDNLSEAAKTILDAWCLQIGEARKSGKSISNTTLLPTRANDAKLYKTAQWSQEEPYNREAPVINNRHSLTGCAATAMAIICHYNKWPSKGVGTTPEYSYTDEHDNVSHTIPANKLGRTYEYDKMLMSYTTNPTNYTEEQANAVATLMKDMGTSIKMEYHPKGSGATDINVVSAFMTYFGYSKNAYIKNGASVDYDEWTTILRENLRNYGPTFFAGVNYTGGGHAYILDGYDESNRFHINYGWNGTDDGYYYLPASEYYKNQNAILSLVPEREGTSQYHDNLAFIGNIEYQSGELANTGLYSYAESYSQGSSFYCSIGYICNQGAANFKGYLKLVLCDKEGNWKEELWSLYVTIKPSSMICIDNNYITITEAISKGDRIRLYYKGDYSQEWQWARSRSSTNTTDEIIVIASAEELAEGLSLSYDKNKERLTLKNRHAMKVKIYVHDTNQLHASKQLHAFQNYIKEIPSGEIYRIEVSLGAESYKLIVKL